MKTNFLAVVICFYGIASDITIGAKDESTSALGAGTTAKQGVQQTSALGAGTTAKQGAQQTTALGAGTTAKQGAQQTSALGAGTTAKQGAQQTSALGAGTTAKQGAQQTSALGAGTTAKQGAQQISTLGAGTTAKQGVQQTSALGAGTTAKEGAQQTSALGAGTTAKEGAQQISTLGAGTTAKEGAQQTSALGAGTTAKQGAQQTSALGAGTTAKQGVQQTSALGAGTTAKQGAQQTSALGAGTTAKQGVQQTSALGAGTTAKQGAQQTSALGAGTTAKQGAQQTSALGAGTTAKEGAQQTSALGAGTTAKQGAQQTSALGAGTTAKEKAQQTSALGAGTTAKQGAQQTSALGAGTTAKQGAQQTSALGAGTTAKQGAQQTSALGAGTTAKQGAQQTSALGAGTTAKQGAQQTSALGAGTTAKQGAQQTSALGAGTTAKQGVQQTSALGAGTTAKQGAQQTSALGAGNTAKQGVQQTSALGAGTTAKQGAQQTSALGAGTTANEATKQTSGLVEGRNKHVTTPKSSESASTLLTIPPPTVSPHPERANFNLDFSLKLNATFSKDLDDKTSASYLNYSAAFTKVIKRAFAGVPGFRHIIIKGFRNGSIICNYIAVIEATANTTEVIEKINGSVKDTLQHANVNGYYVNGDYLNRTLIKDLADSKTLMSCRCKAEGICNIGYRCSEDDKKVKCTSNCNDTDCGDHGVCQLKADGQPICRCKKHPKYVYSGDNCEITGEQLLLKSEYIAAIAGGAGGGLVLILVIALICTCVRKRKAKENRDGPLLNAYDEGIQQQWTSTLDGPREYNTQAYETIPMDQLPTKRKNTSVDEEPFSVYQPSNIPTPITRASAEFASFMDEGSTSVIHALPIKTLADTSYASHHDHDGRYNRDEDARLDAGHVPSAVQGGILNDVRRHDKRQEDHYRTGAEKSFDTNRLSSAVSGPYANVKEHHRENISVTKTTPQMQIQNPSFHRQEQDGYPTRDHLRRDDSPSFHRQEQDGYPSRDHLRRDDSPSFHRQEQDGYPSRDHLRRDDSPSFHRQEQDSYPSRDHLRRDDPPLIHRQEQNDFRGQNGYIPKDRNLERLHREERISDRKHGRHESFRNDRRSFREADRVQQTPVPSPKHRPKTFGEMRHPNSFIAVPEPDYGVEHDSSGMEHDRQRPSQDNESRDGGQLYRSESLGRVNDSAFARDLQRRGQEIKRTEGQGAKDRLRETKDRRGQWEHPDRRSENWSRQGRDGNERRHFNHNR